MIVSDTYKFVFVEVPKTASTSIRNMLLPLDTPGHGFRKHAAAARAANAMGRDRWDSYHSFAVLRSPHDWLFSWYKFWRGQVITKNLDESDPKFVGDEDFDSFVFNAIKNPEAGRYTKIGDQERKVIDPNTGELLVKELICYETLAQDLDVIKARLALPPTDPLPQLNRSKFKPEKTGMSNKSRKMIARKWARDMELYEEAQRQSAARAAEG